MTQEALDEVVAERDARFTEDQIRALSADYTIGLNEAGNVQMKFNLFESTDLNTFAPLTLNPDSVSVVEGAGYRASATRIPSSPHKMSRGK
ncbi:MAG: hypothetical protein P8M65_03465 [Roseibacillus sp.]|nr:hypothetical protein [Roseibacillus sp.]